MNLATSRRLAYENPISSNAEKVRHTQEFVEAYHGAKAGGLSDAQDAEWLDDWDEEMNFLNEKPLMSPKVTLITSFLPPRSTPCGLPCRYAR
jgi:hypothetical protein